MKSSVLSYLGGLVVGVVVAAGQTAYGQYTNYNFASTAAEGYARGIADIIRARGQAYAMTGQGALSFTQARRQAIENWYLWTKNYFEIRRLNREYQLAMRGPRPRPEDYIRYAQMGRPQRLSPSQLDTVTGQINNWPIVLQTPLFDYYRGALQTLFAQRAERGGLAPAAYFQVYDVTNAAIAQLQDLVRRVPPEDYMAARRFLESLAFEARHVAE